mmetsp:Transcript_114469/g.328882  ORF Transcript_114469/g.328882 Transcript_114469/m.328882 type:complete len:160 (-) Transcript_114469:78-557(-)
MRSWYDYLTDHDGQAEDALNLATLDDVCSMIHALIDQEVAAVGARRVFLGGASQGCCTALHAAATYHKHALGGVIGTQGHLLACTKWPEDWSKRETPVRIFIGLEDTTMRWDEWVAKSFAPMRQAGGNLVFVTEPGVDHGDDQAEGRWIRSFLAELFPS